MEDHHRDVFGLVHEIVHAIQELLRRQVVASGYMSTDMVVIPNVDHQVILVGLLVALDDPSKLLAHPIPVKEQLETSDKAYMPYFVGDVPWRHPSIRHVRGSGQQSAGRS